MNTDPSAPPAAAPETTPTPISGLEPPNDAEQWQALVKVLPLSGPARQLARFSQLLERADDHWYLELPADQDYLLSEAHQSRLQETLQQALARPVHLHVRLAERAPTETAEPAKSVRPPVEEHPVVRAVEEKLGGQVLPETIEQGESLSGSD